MMAPENSRGRGFGRWEAAAWAGLLALSLAARFQALDAKPLHHDESLFCYYSWRIHAHGDHAYQPILHGPLFLYGAALVYGLGADGVWGARFWPALLGGLLPLAALLFRRRWGAWASLYAGLGLALSPPLMFYARFFRHDIPLCALIVCQIAAARLWWRVPKSNAAACVLGFATILPLGVKENYLIADFTFFCFLHLWIWAGALGSGRIRELFRGGFLANALRAGNAAGVGSLATLALIKLFLPPQISNPSKALLALTLLAAFDYWLLAMLWHRGREAGIERDGVFARIVSGIGRSWPGLLAGAGLATFFLQMAVTHAFAQPEAPHDAFNRTFEYWLGQHEEHRLKGPFHYYISILATYHLPALLLCFGAMAARCFDMRKRFAYIGVSSVLLGAGLLWAQDADWPARLMGSDAEFYAWLDQRLHMTSLLHVWIAFILGAGSAAYALLLLLERRTVHAFCAFWTCWSALIYGYAGEKIPWVSTHIALPLMLWCGAEAAALLERFRGRWARRFLASAFALQLIWMGFNAWRACFPNAADPAERIVYNHTAPHFLGAVEMALGVAEGVRDNGGEPVIHYDGEPFWPLVYYFRDFENQALDWPEEEWPFAEVLFLDSAWDAPDEVRETHVWFDVPFRRYWMPELFWLETREVVEIEETPGGSVEYPRLKKVFLPADEAFGNLLKYYLFREPFYNPAEPGGVWGSGETAQFVSVGVRSDLLDPGNGSAAGRAAREFAEKFDGGFWP